MYKIQSSKDIIEKNTESVIELLELMYKNISLETNKDFYRTITTYYSAISIIIKKLKTDEESTDKIILLDNVLLNFCSLIHCVVLKDIKLINFIYRNIIESVIRYIANDFTTRDLEQLFKILTNYSLHVSSGTDLVRKYGGQLKYIYTKNCSYVHTDPSKIPTNLVNLTDYQSIDNQDQISYLKKDFEILNTAIIGLFKVLYKDKYIDLPINNKIYIDEITPLKNRTEYQAFLHDCQ